MNEVELAKRAWELRTQGYSYGQIAKELGISKSTAYQYVQKFQEAPLTEEEKKELAKEDIREYVENESELKVSHVDRVIEEINKNIVPVEEVAPKKKKDSFVDELKTKVKENKFWLLGLVGVVVALVVFFFLVRSRSSTDSTTNSKEQNVSPTNQSQNVSNQTSNSESTYDWIKRVGINEDESVVL